MKPIWLNEPIKGNEKRIAILEAKIERCRDTILNTTSTAQKLYEHKLIAQYARILNSLKG